MKTMDRRLAIISEQPTVMRNMPLAALNIIPESYLEELEENGIIISPIYFKAPVYCTTFADYFETFVKWVLKKKTSIPMMESDSWQLDKMVDLKKKGIPFYAIVEQHPGIAYIIDLEASDTLIGKMRRMLCKTPDFISPYCVMQTDSIAPGPLYSLRTRLSGYVMKGIGIKLERIHSNTISISWDMGGRNINYRYSYCIKSFIINPMAFYLFLKFRSKDVQQEMEGFVRSVVESKRNQIQCPPSCEMRGTFSLPIFEEIGYNIEASYVIKYVS